MPDAHSRSQARRLKACMGDKAPVYVAIDLMGGVIVDVTAYRCESDVEEAEAKWLEEIGIETPEDRHAHMDNGREFRIFVCQPQ